MRKDFFKKFTGSLILAFLTTSLETIQAQEDNEWGGFGRYQEDWKSDTPHKLIQEALKNNKRVGLRIGPPVDLSSEVDKTAVLAFEGSMFTDFKEFFENENHIPIWMNANHEKDEKKTFWNLFQNSFNLVYISDGTIYSIDHLPQLLQTILTKEGKAVIMCTLRLKTPNTKFGTYIRGMMPNSWHDEGSNFKIPEKFDSEIEIGADGGPNPNTNTGAANTAILWVSEEKYKEFSTEWSKGEAASEEVQNYQKEMRSLITKTWEPYFKKVEIIGFSNKNRPSYTDHDVNQKRSQIKDVESAYGYLIISDPKKE